VEIHKVEPDYKNIKVMKLAVKTLPKYQKKLRSSSLICTPYFCVEARVGDVEGE